MSSHKSICPSVHPLFLTYSYVAVCFPVPSLGGQAPPSRSGPSLAAEVPNLFSPEDKEKVINACTEAARAAGGGETRDAVYSFFINRVRDNLHIVPRPQLQPLCHHGGPAIPFYPNRFL